MRKKKLVIYPNFEEKKTVQDYKLLLYKQECMLWNHVMFDTLILHLIQLSFVLFAVCWKDHLIVEIHKCVNYNSIWTNLN